MAVTYTGDLDIIISNPKTMLESDASKTISLLSTADPTSEVYTVFKEGKTEHPKYFVYVYDMLKDDALDQIDELNERYGAEAISRIVQHEAVVYQKFANTIAGIILDCDGPLKLEYVCSTKPYLAMDTLILDAIRQEFNVLECHLKTLKDSSLIYNIVFENK